MIFIPPGGFAGAAQQVPAVKQSMARAAGRVATRGKRTRRKKKAAAAPRRRKATRRKTSKSAARLVKGSAAAKRYMAKIRKLRKKK